MNLARAERPASRRAARAGRARRVATQGVIDPRRAALAQDQLAAMEPIATPRRPQALHLALRYERLVREGKVSAAADSIRAFMRPSISLQERMPRLARRYLDGFRDAGARQVAVMVAERGSAIAILAEVGSARFGDASDAGAFDFTRVTRSPGSTLKPFVYALAFERGALKATDLSADVPEGASGVNNADGIFLGPMPPRQALANSRNVPAPNLLRRVGVEANFQFPARPRPARTRSPGGILRRLHGDRLAADEARQTDARLCGACRRWLS